MIVATGSSSILAYRCTTSLDACTAEVRPPRREERGPSARTSSRSRHAPHGARRRACRRGRHCHGRRERVRVPAGVRPHQDVRDRRRHRDRWHREPRQPQLPPRLRDRRGVRQPRAQRRARRRVRRRPRRLSRGVRRRARTAAVRHPARPGRRAAAVAAAATVPVNNRRSFASRPCRYRELVKRIEKVVQTPAQARCRRGTTGIPRPARGCSRPRRGAPSSGGTPGSPRRPDRAPRRRERPRRDPAPG